MRRLLFCLLLMPLFIMSSCSEAGKFEPVESVPEYMEIIRVIPTIGRPYYIDITEDYFLISEDQAGFSIYDRATSELQSRVSEYEYFEHFFVDNIRYAKMVEKDGQRFIYALERMGPNPGLLIFNVDDFDNPQCIDRIAENNIERTEFIKINMNQADELEIFFTLGPREYHTIFTFGVVESFGGMGYLDVATSNLPNKLSGFDIRDNIAFIAGLQRGLYIFDMDSRTLLSETNLPGEAINVRVKDDYAYVVCKQEGLQVVDISNPDNPELVFSFETEGWAQDIDIENDYIAVASGGGGAYLYKISENGEPVFLERLGSDLVDYAYIVKLQEGKIYIGGRYLGITEALIKK